MEQEGALATRNSRRRIGAVLAAFCIGFVVWSVAPADVLADQPEPASGEPAAVTPRQPPRTDPVTDSPAATEEQPAEARPPDPAVAGAEPAVAEPAEGEASGTAAATAAQPAPVEEETAAEAAVAEQTAAQPAPVEEETAAEAAVAEQTAAEQPATAPPAAADPPVTSPEPRRITRGEVVRIGGSVRIERDERVLGDVVVILGGLRVDGRVTGDIVVVGGSARFGPQAVARGDVTVVGGSLRRASSAVLSGSVTEVGLGSARGFTDSGWWQFGWPGGNWFGSGDLLATVMRLLFLGLLASGIVLVARAPVERIAHRARAEPLKAGVVGLLAQMLTVPAFVLGILGLVISIIGIPFLLLLPFVVGGVGLIMLVGFSGAVLGAGELARNRMGAPGSTVFVSVWAGLALILLPTMAGEAVGVVGGLFSGLGVLLVLAGFLLEYAAWTTGLGALILNRFAPAPPAPGGFPSGGLSAGSPPPVPLAPVAPSPSVPPVEPDKPLPGSRPAPLPADSVEKPSAG